MPPEIIEIENTEYSYPHVVANFDSISELIKRVKHTSSPIYLHGEDIHEESLAFSRARYLDGPLISREYGLYYGIKKEFADNILLYNKISYFMNSSGWQLSKTKIKSIIDDNVISSLCDLGEVELYSRIEERYVKSRKIKEGALDGVVKFLSHLPKDLGGGPLVADGQYWGGVPFSIILAIRLWHNTGRRVPLILLVEGFSPPDVPNVTSREYLQLGDVVAKGAKFIGTSEVNVRNALSFWKAQLSGSARQAVNDGKCSGQLASSLIFTAGRMDPVEDLSTLSQIIPGQRPAPITFVAQESIISIAHEGVSDLAYPQVLGAARALRGQAFDVLAVGGLDNAIPQCKAKIERVVSILDRISLQGYVDESDVVEMGVEFSGLEYRVSRELSRIGELTVGEMLSFIMSGKSFLQRFRVWVEYRDSERIYAIDNSEGNAEIAVDILRQFASMEGLLSVEARERILKFLSDETKDVEDPVKREGYSISAENLAAVAGGEIVKELKEEASSAISETRDAVRAEFVKKASEIIIKNSGRMVEFASSRGGHWLEMLVSVMGGGKG